VAPTVLVRICRRADGWLARAAGSTNGVIGDWARIQRRLLELGRPPGSVTFGHLNFMHVGSTDDEAMALRVQRPLLERVMGTMEHFADLLPARHAAANPRPPRRAGPGRA
jgi:alkanesulfonate monooxygenase SsuD/methylene tetrahydromethanopterin reductase-like flavin-dependent oxidoreductase (luciferase family)